MLFLLKFCVLLPSFLQMVLCMRIGEDPHYVEASCHVLSSTKIVPSDYKMSKRARRVFHVDRGISHPISRAIDQRATEYLQDKLQSRLDKTVIETVFSCFIALQMQAEKNDARNNRSKFAGTDRVWFDQRAIVIGNYLACGEQTTFLEFARSRKLSRKNGESESPTEHVSTESDSVQREPSTKERSLRKERKANSTMKSTPKLEQTSKANMTNAVSSPKTSKQTNFGNAGKEDSFEMLHDDSPTRVTWSF